MAAICDISIGSLFSSGQAEQNLINTQTTFVRPNGQEVRIHMTRTLNPPILPPAASYNREDPPPPAFDREEPAPPSYQDFNKDVLIQPSRSV
ncbi:hypothetical protein INT47_001632 [Mucor saturninus]|uniref:Uncharacterized protein n=1 Tax=Mucor saturninus TaxID=64648 RepID=A0A8H7VDA2_9FUNG|nr:hypothetical protein INT47_001632 [Mucor saturninus]